MVGSERRLASAFHLCFFVFKTAFHFTYTGAQPPPCPGGGGRAPTCVPHGVFHPLRYSGTTWIRKYHFALPPPSPFPSVQRGSVSTIGKGSLAQHLLFTRRGGPSGGAGKIIAATYLPLSTRRPTHGRRLDCGGGSGVGGGWGVGGIGDWLGWIRFYVPPSRPTNSPLRTLPTRGRCGRMGAAEPPHAEAGHCICV